jgi:hypothetical protein
MSQYEESLLKFFNKYFVEIRLSVMEFLHAATWTADRYGDLNRGICATWFRNGLRLEYSLVPPSASTSWTHRVRRLCLHAILVALCIVGRDDLAVS